ncbi:hypothetical protein BH20ACT18_BH20ACT18_06230 [soil metagenome]
MKPGVTYQQFKEAWVPERLDGDYPATARVGRNVENDRQVITIIELDVPVAELKAVTASLTRPDALERLGEIVETTEVEAVYEDVFDERSLPQ